MVRWIWTASNTEHIARHDLRPADVEAVTRADDYGEDQDPTSGRITMEGTTAVGFIRVLAAPTAPDELYCITAYALSPKRRKTGRTP
jgi:hypothetical protein